MSGASIGELFKVLGNNEIFFNYCKEIDNNISINEIIDRAIKDTELMLILNNIIEDNDIIKKKMEIIIGQKKKMFEKKNEKKPEKNEKNDR